MNTIAVFKMQGKRLFSRVESRFAVTAALIIAAIAFIESCVCFYGFDVKALPSASYGWTWNMDPLQIQTMRVFAYFLIFILAASVFADNLLLDIKRGVAACVASRCPLSSYLVSNALLTFIGGFLITMLPLVVSQLLAFLIFPITGSFEGHYNTPVYVLEDASGTLFPQLAANYPYLNNLMYVFYASFWAGSMALLSFALSLFIKKSRLIIIGIPTAIALLSWYIVPALTGSSVIMTHFRYLYPGPQTAEMSVAYFVFAPLAIVAIAAALIIWALHAKKDILL